MTRLEVGTSGWMYDDWRGAFYPKTCPKRGWLSYYAERFSCVELNNSFYRLPTREQFSTWSGSVPEDFVFAVKVSRYLSHVKRLREPAEPIERFLDRTEGLGDRLGPCLLQLPPTLRRDDRALETVLRLWPTDRVRLAVEFRHESWFCSPVRSLLERHGAALCLTDRRNHRPEPHWATAEWGFVRLHEGTATPHPCYGRDALHRWHDRVHDLWPNGDAYVFFNNDHGACAVRNAESFRRLASGATP